MIGQIPSAKNVAADVPRSHEPAAEENWRLRVGACLVFGAWSLELPSVYV